MRLRKLQEKVKEHQEKVGEKVQHHFFPYPFPMQNIDEKNPRETESLL